MTSTAGPRVVTNGLIRWLDPANEKSYTSGTNWYDLLDATVSATLESGVVLRPNESQGVLYGPDNANGKIRLSSIHMNLTSSDYTVCVFSRKTTVGDNGRVLSAEVNNWLLGHHDTTSGDYFAQGWVNQVDQGDITIWRMFTGTGDIAGDSYSLYVNDEHIVTNSNGSQGPNGFIIGDYRDSLSQFSAFEISALLVYDRVLTEAEIKQNYYALRKRFGL